MWGCWSSCVTHFSDVLLHSSFNVCGMLSIFSWDVDGPLQNTFAPERVQYYQENSPPREVLTHTPTNAREVRKVILQGGWTSLACLARPPWFLPLTKTEEKDELVAHLMAKKATETLRRRAASVGLFCQVAQCAHREFGPVAT